jgi:hypothetical protein
MSPILKVVIWYYSELSSAPIAARIFRRLPNFHLEGLDWQAPSHRLPRWGPVWRRRFRVADQIRRTESHFEPGVRPARGTIIAKVGAFHWAVVDSQIALKAK